MPRKTTYVDVDGRQLSLSNLDKVLYPAVGFTKAQVLDYYARIAPIILPHLAGYPVTLKRYPEGVNEEFFYQKNCPAHRPKWIETATVPSEHKAQGTNLCLVDSVASLAWILNLASLEIHTLLARASDLQRPTAMVFDLDPGEGADIMSSARIGMLVRKVLTRLGLESFPKTSGGKGLHLYVPLNTPATFDQTKAFSRRLAEAFAVRLRDHVTANMRKSLRQGKVFIDWSQNDIHKTTVCVYSLRARTRPTVSTPVAWTEIEKALKADDPMALTFETHEVLDHVARKGDLFEPVLTLQQKLPGLADLDTAIARVLADITPTGSGA